MKKNKILSLGLVTGLLITLASVGGCIPAGEEAAGGFDPTLIIFLVLIFGLIIAARFKRFHLILAYAVPFALLMSIYALKNDYPVWPHILFLNFYFMVFMVVEPKTSPLYRGGRIVYASLAAVLTFFFFNVLPEYDASVLSLAAANLAVPVLNYQEKRKKLGRQ